jgi:hypothetical protein
MMDRQKLETILRRRFPGSELREIAAAANAIMGLGDEWEPIPHPDPDRLTEELHEGAQFLIFRRTDHERRS